MKVSVKDFAVSMEMKNKGIEFEVYGNDDAFLGDLVVTKSKVIWCRGKTTVENGHVIKWPEFIKLMETFPKS